MPHLIFQTKFPVQEQTAEISFFGSIERETMEMLQASTFATLQQQANFDGQNSGPTSTPAGYWRSSPYSPHVVHFVINIPGSWECRHAVQNVLRIAWMDVFENAGWNMLAMWNCQSGSEYNITTPLANIVTTEESPESNTNIVGSAAAESLVEGGDFKGECVSFLFFKRAGTGIQTNVPTKSWPSSSVAVSHASNPLSRAPQGNANPAGSVSPVSDESAACGNKRRATENIEDVVDAQGSSKE